MTTVLQLYGLDYTRYRQHLLKLDQTSRYMRFGFNISDEGINKLCDEIETHINMHKIFIIENSDLEVIAAGHIALDQNDWQKMELAFSVLEPYRNHGYASKLMERCLEWCRNRNITAGFMVCLSNNTVMKHLAEKHGIDMYNEEGEVMAEIRLPIGNGMTYMRELIETNLATMDHLGKSNAYTARKFIFNRFTNA